jgi:bifunctional DNase/RNase
VLEEVGGERRLPIWIGTPEALSLVAALEEVELPRPGPYHFAQALLAAAGGALREVRISRLDDNVFYAVAVLADGSEVDARPSDALTLALVTGAPIAAEPAVLEESERHTRERPRLFADVSAPADSASVLAEEVRAHLAQVGRELNEPPAEP